MGHALDSTYLVGHKTEVQGGGLDVKAQDVGNDWISEVSGCCAVIKVCGLFPRKPWEGERGKLGCRWDDQEGHRKVRPEEATKNKWGRGGGKRESNGQTRPCFLSEGDSFV